ncbi:MAG: sigma-54-dependent Fis family transcriptional regulator, partial [Bacteroidetes bacterium]|nr:sigma-54-dependent Fis family transcriptional regulator [Bacteroidota bacterium]
HWPGNVREVRNVVESMLVLEGGKYIEADVVKKYLKEYQHTSEERHLPVPVGRSVEQAERELILRALLDIKGNIMELKNIVLQQAEALDSVHRSERENSFSKNPSVEPDLSLEGMERKMIAEALERHNGNRRIAARVLNISERTLYRKIKEYGLE